MEKMGFNLDDFLLNLYDNDYDIFIGKVNTFAINREGHVYRVTKNCDKFTIKEMDIDFSKFNSPYEKTKIICMVTTLFEKGLLKYDQDNYGSDLLMGDLTEWCKLNSNEMRGNTSTNFLYAYCYAISEYHKIEDDEKIFLNVEDVTNDYVPLSWDDFFEKVQNYADNNSLVYGFFDNWSGKVVAFYDNHGWVKLLEYTIDDNQKVTIKSEIRCFNKFDAPKNISDIIDAYQFIIAHKELFKHDDDVLDNFKYDVDRYLKLYDSNNTDVIPPLYTEYMFVKSCILKK